MRGIYRQLESDAKYGVRWARQAWQDFLAKSTGGQATSGTQSQVCQSRWPNADRGRGRFEVDLKAAITDN
jgi:hypothetical protein